MLEKDQIKSSINISNAEVSDLLDTHFFKDLKKNKYDIKEKEARTLLTFTRFDLAFKLVYLDLIDREPLVARKIYLDHIRAFTLGRFKEPGNSEKNSATSYINEFDKIYDNLKNNGFDIKKSVLPLSKNFSIANGAHRLASAIKLNIPIKYANIACDDQIYDYNFFFSRNIPQASLDLAALKFIEHSKNCFLAFVWPAAKGGENQIGNLIPNIVYKSEVTLNQNGAHNLLSQIYANEHWVGSVEENFPGTKSKTVKCFPYYSPVRLIVFQADDLNDVLLLKQKVRSIFDIGKHSIHITDNHNETLMLAKQLFNRNSIHFLNHAEPRNFLSTHSNLQYVHNLLTDRNIKYDNVLLTGDIILSVYGIKETKTSFSELPEFLLYADAGSKKISNLNSLCDNKSRQSLIYDPQNYFYFQNLKFLSLPKLYDCKQQLGAPIDPLDLKIIHNLIHKRISATVFGNAMQYLIYSRILIRARLVTLSKRLGVYLIMKSLYNILSKRR